MQGTAMLFIGALMVVGVTFHYYAPAPTCRLNIFFIAWTLILGIVYTFVSVRSAIIPYPTLPYPTLTHPTLPYVW